MKEKLSLGSIKNVLSRAEMKNIMAGSGGGGTCSSSSCTLFANGITYSGSCGMFGGYNPPCLCVTDYGSYTPTSGTSHCVV